MSAQEAVTIQKPKKRGRPSVLDTRYEFRLPWDDVYLIQTLAMYERRDTAELLRGEINSLRKEYRKDNRFRDWVARHKEDLAKKGIKSDDIW